VATENNVADEGWLLQRCRHGDRRAFVALTYNHLQGVYSIALNLSSTEGDAAWLTQRALRLTWRRIPSMPADLPFRILVRRVVVGLAIERLRSAPPPAAESLEAFLPSFDRNGSLVAVANDAAGLESLFDRPDIAQRIREALGRIDATERAAFVLWHIEELSLGDAAAILELPAESVRKRSHRACSMLSGYLRQLARRPRSAHAD
jgi:RNA polymerase sigma-70 factor (ECF subfamily)